MTEKSQRLFSFLTFYISIYISLIMRLSWLLRDNNNLCLRTGALVLRLLERLTYFFSESSPITERLPYGRTDLSCEVVQTDEPSPDQLHPISRTPPDTPAAGPAILWTRSAGAGSECVKPDLLLSPRLAVKTRVAVPFVSELRAVRAPARSSATNQYLDNCVTP